METNFRTEKDSVRNLEISGRSQQQNLNDGSIEIIQSEEHREKCLEKNEQRPRDLWNNIKWSNIHIIVVHKGEKED